MGSQQNRNNQLNQEFLLQIIDKHHIIKHHQIELNNNKRMKHNVK